MVKIPYLLILLVQRLVRVRNLALHHLLILYRIRITHNRQRYRYINRASAERRLTRRHGAISTKLRKLVITIRAQFARNARARRTTTVRVMCAIGLDYRFGGYDVAARGEAAARRRARVRSGVKTSSDFAFKNVKGLGMVGTVRVPRAKTISLRQLRHLHALQPPIHGAKRIS